MTAARAAEAKKPTMGSESRIRRYVVRESRMPDGLVLISYGIRTERFLRGDRLPVTVALNLNVAVEVADLDIYNRRGHEVKVTMTPSKVVKGVDWWRMGMGIPLSSRPWSLGNVISLFSGVRGAKTFLDGHTTKAWRCQPE